MLRVPRRLAKNQGGIPCPACDAPPWVIEAHLQDQLEVSTTVQYAAALRYQLFDAENNEARIPVPVPDAEVELTGLVNRPELNGVRGRVVRYISDKDWWLVELNDGHGKASLKAENMREV